jgi:hypothetical protein
MQRVDLRSLRRSLGGQIARAYLEQNPHLHSTQEREHDADNQDNNRDPYEEVSAAHGGRSDAPEPEQPATSATTIRTSA